MSDLITALIICLSIPIFETLKYMLRRVIDEPTQEEAPNQVEKST